MDQHILQEKLSALRLPGIRWHETTGSTNDLALEWIASGAQEGSLVVADTQTRGRGRLGRRWITQPGSALAFSLALKPTPAEAARLALFSPLGALAVCRALEEGWGLEPQIKWPNDVLLSGKKTCGILAEAAWVGSTLEGLVIGIGINVTAASVPPDEEIIYPATSVEQAAGLPVDRFDLLYAVLRALFACREFLLTPRFLEEWENRLAFKGERVSLVSDAERPFSGERIEGVLKGIDAEGNLLLQLATGETRAISVGDVHLRPASFS